MRISTHGHEKNFDVGGEVPYDVSIVQNERFWPDGVAGAVSLTYDGTTLGHAEIVLPFLARFGLRGTFFAEPVSFLDQAPVWREAARMGHEIANGCLLRFAEPTDGLPTWTPEMIAGEVEQMELLLTDQLRREAPFSFAFPKGPPFCANRADYREIIAADGRFARSGLDGWNHPTSCMLSYLRGVQTDGFDSDQLIEIVSQAMRRGGWIVLAMEGIGEGDAGIDRSAHHRLVEFLAGQQEIWTAPLDVVGRQIRMQRGNHLRLA